MKGRKEGRNSVPCAPLVRRTWLDGRQGMKGVTVGRVHPYLSQGFGAEAFILQHQSQGAGWQGTEGLQGVLVRPKSLTGSSPEGSSHSASVIRGITGRKWM